MDPPLVVAVSAPGKVLLAGGYLVLDRKYTGLVFALDARMHVVIESLPPRSGVARSEITVRSPQFEGAVWEYDCRLAQGGSGGFSVMQMSVDADPDLDRNIFIENALSYALGYVANIWGLKINSASITILADNDYYSTPPKSLDTDSAPPKFHNFGVPISKAAKTGLGSSAALVTALTAALLIYYAPDELFDLSTERDKRRLHNLAQAAHCAAQGKVGSGFDVASAVYGSCLYRRFSPSFLAERVTPGSAGFAAQVGATVDETGDAGPWDTEVRKDLVKVPKGLRLVMCDVSCGSKTPGMVKKVLAWRKEKPEEAEKVWMELQEANQRLAVEMSALAGISAHSTPDYSRLTRCFHDIRQLIRAMSAASGVPIEPEAQMKLLDACQAVPGVVGGVVPGAGGFDAVALLVEAKEQTMRDLTDLLAEWKFESEDGQASGRVSMLGVREEMQGLRLENPSDYNEFRQRA